jgi:hypothetical protein
LRNVKNRAFQQKIRSLFRDHQIWTLGFSTGKNQILGFLFGFSKLILASRMVLQTSSFRISEKQPRQILYYDPTKANKKFKIYVLLSPEHFIYLFICYKINEINQKKIFFFNKTLMNIFVF